MRIFLRNGSFRFYNYEVVDSIASNVREATLARSVEPDRKLQINRAAFNEATSSAFWDDGRFERRLHNFDRYLWSKDLSGNGAYMTRLSAGFGADRLFRDRKLYDISLAPSNRRRQGRVSHFCTGADPWERNGAASFSSLDRHWYYCRSINESATKSVIRDYFFLFFLQIDSFSIYPRYRVASSWPG